MPYDEAEMSKIRRDFAAWVKQQPDDATYRYGSLSDCAVGQYLAAIGVSVTAPVKPWIYYAATHQGRNRRNALTQEGMGFGPLTFGVLKDFIMRNEEDWV